MVERMTEADWLDNDRANPQWMLWQLTPPLGKVTRTRAGRRKLRLFACACCRLVDPYLDAFGLSDSVGVAERFAEGQATSEELAAAHARIARPEFQEGTDSPRLLAYWAPRLAQIATGTMADISLFLPPYRVVDAGFPGSAIEANARLCDLVRCVFGNPFRPVAPPQPWLKWNGGALVRLARVIDDERAFDQLPVLADALEEAGCTDAAILAHCRGPGPHVRGCWVVDLLLGTV
jgi:hypothetical protein